VPGLSLARSRAWPCRGPVATPTAPHRLLIVNEHHLRLVLTEYLLHPNTARPHRALGQLAPAQARTRSPEINLAEQRIRRRQLLGGLIHEYQIAA
jgi:putative transposase